MAKLTTICLLLCISTVLCSDLQVSWKNSVLKNRVRRDESRDKSIFEEAECIPYRSYCNVENDDISILECLLALHPDNLQRFDNKCQNIIWSHITSLLDNKKVKEVLYPVCSNVFRTLDCKFNEGSVTSLKCIVGKKDSIDNTECLTLVNKLENVAFYDFRFISEFLQDCSNDIDKLKCGRLDHNGLSNSNTIVCLQNNFYNVTEQCRTEVLKLSEIQSDNIKLDRQLYLSCAEDQMRYCRQFAPGSGRVFKCLMDHRQEILTDKCLEHLLRRQKLISEDYRVSKGLLKACKEEIKKSHCRKQTSDDKTIRLSQVLLCLENVVKNGTKVENDCRLEMRDHRKMLMEDYRLSPEIVSGCSLEIKKFCKEVGSKTIHCLMDIARPNGEEKRVRSSCERVLETLIEETDAGEDWRVDPVLHDACASVVNVACKDITNGDANVISCLMDNLRADHMTNECEDALMQIQYFIARDFKLDPQLYRACKQDAVTICNANENWEEEKYRPSNAPLILPCLYRSTNQVKPACQDQIKRVMRQRAVSVDLQPEIEQVCIQDLALFCFKKIEKGQEMLCLQDNLDNLEDEDCRKAIEQLTEDEAEHVELNPYIMTHCQEVIDKLCSPEEKHDDGDVMDCLISHKNDPFVKSRQKCRVSIEHFQIISIKDYRFSYKFKVACKAHALRFCAAAKSKSEVVACLSEKITNDTISGVKSPIHKECRQQLKAQLFQQRENIDFDPKLSRVCSADIESHCKDIPHGSSQVLECLQAVTTGLSEACETELFKIKKQELSDNSVDYALMRMCADTIKIFCPITEESNVLECLKKNKDEKGFNKKCRVVVVHRINEQNSDYRLNPALQENCKLDIKKFCNDIVVRSKPNKELNGQVINCLKKAFRRSKLTNTCENQMSSILEEQALDVQLNPLLRAVCKSELDTICKMDSENDHGDAEECLKSALKNHKIETLACQIEVANIIIESQADINVDPLLHQVCSLDLLKFCKDIPQGNGRHIKCLKVIMADSSKELMRECKEMLTKRLELYKNAAEIVPPADFQQLYSQVVTSPARNIFFIFFLTLVGLIFMLGSVCGRVSRRHQLIKNK